jgi:hypothetical protein
MTVAELLALLARFPLTSRVLVDGYEGGLEDVSTLALVPIQADANLDNDSFGAHLIDDKSPVEMALWIKSSHPRGDVFDVSDMQRLKARGLW